MTQKQYIRGTEGISDGSVDGERGLRSYRDARRISKPHFDPVRTASKEPMDARGFAVCAALVVGMLSGIYFGLTEGILNVTRWGPEAVVCAVGAYIAGYVLARLIKVILALAVVGVTLYLVLHGAHH